MKRLLVAFALSLAGLGLVTGQTADAQTLSAAAYCDLTIERLSLAHDTWSREGRSPTEGELLPLWQRYGVTAAAYYRFATDNRAVVEGYLGTHPDVAQEIQRLAVAINAVIRQREPR